MLQLSKGRHASISQGGRSTGGSCLSELLLCRFLYIVQYFVGNGFYVVLDNQIGQFTEDQTIMSNPALLAQNWVNLYTVRPSHGTLHAL